MQVAGRRRCHQVPSLHQGTPSPRRLWTLSGRSHTRTSHRTRCHQAEGVAVRRPWNAWSWTGPASHCLDYVGYADLKAAVPATVVHPPAPTPVGGGRGASFEAARRAGGGVHASATHTSERACHHTSRTDATMPATARSLCNGAVEPTEPPPVTDKAVAAVPCPGDETALGIHENTGRGPSTTDRLLTLSLSAVPMDEPASIPRRPRTDWPRTDPPPMATLMPCTLPGTALRA